MRFIASLITRTTEGQNPLIMRVACLSAAAVIVAFALFPVAQTTAAILA